MGSCSGGGSILRTSAPCWLVEARPLPLPSGGFLVRTFVRMNSTENKGGRHRGDGAKAGAQIPSPVLRDVLPAAQCLPAVVSTNNKRARDNSLAPPRSLKPGLPPQPKSTRRRGQLPQFHPRDLHRGGGTTIPRALIRAGTSPMQRETHRVRALPPLHHQAAAASRHSVARAPPHSSRNHCGSA